MSHEPSTNSTAESPLRVDFEQLRRIVESEFTIEEALVEYNVPTFYVRLSEDSKKAFLRLITHLDSFGLVPVLRDREGTIMLQIVPRPPMTSSRRFINWVLFLATIATTLMTGYFLSFDWLLAGMFAIALLAILGSHELGHTFAAKAHGVESTLPYFIPGPPWPFGIGTFGAVIQQKSLAPNRDALFDLGIAGPIVGLIVTVIVTILGLQMSSLTPPHPEALYLPVSLLFQFIANALLNPPPGMDVMLHPVAFAGWVGMLVTTIQLVPIGMFDGGHAVRSLLGEKGRGALIFISILIFLILGQPIMAILAFMLSMRKHPGPLDDVSKVAIGRKLGAIILVLIFILCATSLWFSF